MWHHKKIILGVTLAISLAIHAAHNTQEETPCKEHASSCYLPSLRSTLGLATTLFVATLIYKARERTLTKGIMRLQKLCPGKCNLEKPYTYERLVKALQNAYPGLDPIVYVIHRGKIIDPTIVTEDEIIDIAQKSPSVNVYVAPHFVREVGG